MSSTRSESTPDSSSAGTDQAGNVSSSSGPASPESSCQKSAEAESTPSQGFFSDCVTTERSSLLSQAATREQLEMELAPTGKRCFRCKKVLPIEAFARMTYRSRPGVEFRNPRCNACRSVHDAGTPRCRRNLQLVAERKARPCVDCGGRFDAVCMDFDHVRGERLFGVVEGMRWKATEALVAEMDKCDVVCSNCHRKRKAAQQAEGRAQGKRRGRPPKFLAELSSTLVEVSPGPRSLWRTYRR
jgi:hypothetical protein